METIPANLFELGATTVVSVIAILALISVIKGKKKANGIDSRMLEQLEILNSNHLETLNKCINENNRNLVETIHDDNTKMIELLGEIKGLLSR